MTRTIGLTALLIATLTLATHSDTPKLQTDEATQAITDYLRSVETARRECLAELTAAEKAALQNGDRQEATRIQAARSAIEGHRAADVFDPFRSLEQRVADTKWANRDNARLWTAFDKDHTLRNTKGEAGKWAVVADNTVASTTGNRYVYLWVFDDDGQNVTLQRFSHDKDHARPYVKQ